MNEDLKRIKALGGRGIYEASRFLPWLARSGVGNVTWHSGSSANSGGEAGAGTGFSQTVSNGAVGSALRAVMGVMSVKKVNVIDGFGLSTRGGIPSDNELISTGCKEEEKRHTVVVKAGRGDIVLADRRHLGQVVGGCEVGRRGRGWISGGLGTEEGMVIERAEERCFMLSLATGANATELLVGPVSSHQT